MTSRYHTSEASVFHSSTVTSQVDDPGSAGVSLDLNTSDQRVGAAEGKEAYPRSAPMQSVAARGDEDVSIFLNSASASIGKRRYAERVEEGFSCPYWVKYGKFRAASCRSSIFQSIPRLKEHLRRVHYKESLCTRCRREYKNLPDHERLNSCKINLQGDLLEFGRLQHNRMIDKARGKTDKEKWLLIWSILFHEPDEDSFTQPTKSDSYHIQDGGDPPSPSPIYTESQLQTNEKELWRKEDQDGNKSLYKTPPSSRHLDETSAAESRAYGNLMPEIVHEVLQDCREKMFKKATEIIEVFHDGSSLSLEDEYDSDCGDSEEGGEGWDDTEADSIRTPSSGSASSSSTIRDRGLNREMHISDAHAHEGRRRITKRGSSSNGGHEEDGDEDSRRNKDQLDRLSAPTCGKRLACPFSKRYPTQTPKARACVYPGFPTVARMKEHLYRHHLCIVCPRCDEVFKDDEAVTEHLNSRIACELKEKKTEREGINSAQRRQLQCKKRRRGENTEEKKWEGVYRILFPSETIIPSPYCEATAAVQVSPTTALLADFEEFSSRQLRTLIMDGIEAEVRRQEVILEATLMTRIPDIIRDANQRLFQQWREHQSTALLESDPTNNASPEYTNSEVLVGPAAELAAMVVPPPEINFDQLLSDVTFPTTSTDLVHSTIPSREDSTYGSSQTSNKANSNDGAASGPAHHSQPQMHPARGEPFLMQSTATAPQEINLHTSVPTPSLSDLAFLDDFQSFPDSILQGSPTTALGTFSSSSQLDMDWVHQECDGDSTQFDYWSTIGDKLTESSGGALLRAEGN